MKIFNFQPVTVDHFEYNSEYLEKSLTDNSYSGGFEVESRLVGGVHEMEILFDLNYTAGSPSNKEVVSLGEIKDGTQYFTIHFSSSTGGGDDYILFAYQASCKFNFESEGYDADIASIVEILVDFEADIVMFLKNNITHPTVLDTHERMRKMQNLEQVAITAIDNMRINNRYEF